MCIVNLTKTDLYLAFDSHHPLEHKLSVVRTLFHRAETVVTTPEDRNSELKHVKTALKRCDYKEWSFKRACLKKDKSTFNKQDSASDTKSKINVVIPFVKGLSEKIKRVYSQYGASTAFKPHHTLRQLLVDPKDKASDEEKSGVVYRYPCKGCDKVYIGETKRSLGDGIKEHLSRRPPTSQLKLNIVKTLVTNWTLEMSHFCVERI